MTIEKAGAGTWVVNDGFVRGFLLEGTEKAVLIDTCASSADAKALAESVTKLPVVLVNTHGDGDHVAGNVAFESFYMHEADYANCGVAERCPDSRVLPIEDGFVLDAGNRPLEMILIPGHTYGSVAVLDVNARVLYTGDSVQDGHIYMFGKHRQPAAFASSLEKLIAMEDRFDCIRAAHGTAELPAGFVRKVLNSWKMVQEGRLEGHPEQLHGRTTVQTYDGPDCGFYCD